MDELQMAALQRARHAVNMAMNTGTVTRSDSFVKACRKMLTKASVGANTTDEIEGESLSALAENFIASIRNRSLLDATARYATPIPEEVNRVLVASGAVAGGADENKPKAITRVAFNADDLTRKKIIGLLVVTLEMIRATGSAGERLFRTELENAVIGASNQALLDAVPVSSSGITATGNVLTDLREGLEAVDDSEGYIVAASRAAVRSLALDQKQGRMSATQGGEFAGDIWVVPADVEHMVVIPASRIALKILPPVVSNASHASVEMESNPADSPPERELVNLWQTGSRGIAVERQFDIFSESEAIAVEPSG